MFHRIAGRNLRWFKNAIDDDIEVQWLDELNTGFEYLEILCEHEVYSNEDIDWSLPIDYDEGE